jgi:hypothetical protein
VGPGRPGCWADALTEYRRVATARERVLGPDHTDTLAGRNNEAHCPERSAGAGRRSSCTGGSRFRGRSRRRAGAEEGRRHPERIRESAQSHPISVYRRPFLMPSIAARV